MTQPIRYTGGQSVKASTLQRGDYVRDPKKVDRICIVLETGATIFIRGLTENDVEHHRYLSPDQWIVKVTNVTTENVIPAKEGTGQE